jgi:hypothetical protein
MIFGEAHFRLLVTIVPAIAMGVLFETFLSPRYDYLGHFLAGYGGTLGACMVWLRLLSDERLAARGEMEILLVCVGCIALGAVTEATIFRIAKFDEIDFCSQSLGAVLAALVAMKFLTQRRLASTEFDRGLIAGIAFLGAGGCFAVA